MTEEELIDYIDSKIKTNGKRNIVGSVLNTALKQIIGLISGASSVAWGNVTGDITDQTDLQSALDAKQDSLGFTPENSANKGNANGYAPLNSSSQIDSSYLPSYVDDVIEVANFAALPGIGSNGKIYVTLDTNLTYRWSGSGYVEISASLALGETSSTAYRGDRGKTAYDHSQSTGNPHGTTASDVDAIKRNGSNANSDVDLGSYELHAKAFKANGTAGDGHYSMKHQSGAPTNSASESSIYANSSGNPAWKNDGNAVQEIALVDTILSKIGWLNSKLSIQSALTGTTSRTIIGSHLIPANMMTGNDVIEFVNKLQRNLSGTSAITLELLYNSTNSLSGATQIATISFLTTSRTTPFERLRLSTDGQTLYAYAGVGAIDNVSTNTVPYNTYTLPTYTGSIYFIVAATLINSADSIQLVSSNLRKF